MLARCARPLLCVSAGRLPTTVAPAHLHISARLGGNQKDKRACSEVSSTCMIRRSYVGCVQLDLARPTREDAPKGGALNGLTISVTGTLSMSRDEAKALISEHGGKFVSAPSSNTSYVVVGDKPGPKKLASIAALGIETMDETSFMAFVADRQAGKRTEK